MPFIRLAFFLSAVSTRSRAAFCAAGSLGTGRGCADFVFQWFPRPRLFGVGSWSKSPSSLTFSGTGGIILILKVDLPSDFGALPRLLWVDVLPPSLGALGLSRFVAKLEEFLPRLLVLVFPVQPVPLCELSSSLTGFLPRFFVALGSRLPSFLRFLPPFFFFVVSSAVVPALMATAAAMSLFRRLPP